MSRVLPFLMFLGLLAGCPKRELPPPPPPTRCEVDLGATGLFSQVGTTARARQVADAAELIGGPWAQGRVGDFLLENDRIRVVVQGPARTISATPWGGTIIDADLKRPAGEAGRDAFGKLEVLYGFGRTIEAQTVEVLQSGEEGGLAVVAATGVDAVLDYFNVPSAMDRYVPGVAFPFNPDQPLPLWATTYYVLSPGEARVRVLTAFCNQGQEPVVTGMGDLIEAGGSGEFFNPQGCTGALGARGCFVDPAPWWGYQYDGVAVGVRPYKFADPATPETKNALLFIAGVTGSLVGGEDQQGLLKWMDATATSRPGTFGVLSGRSRNFLRDFVVGRDLADVQSNFLAFDQAARGRLQVQATLPDGLTPAPFARVAVFEPLAGRQVALLVADAQGRARADFAPGSYTVQAGQVGRALEPPQAVTVSATGQAQVTAKLGAARTLTVAVQDPFGRPLSARVLVRCVGGPCPYPPRAYRPFQDVDDQPSELARVGYVPPQGALTLLLPPAPYEVLVSRGPEYSLWPDTAPLAWAPVDLSAGDTRVDATLAPVVDTSGWMSADLHVHAVNSPDSNVPNEERALSFASEGVDVLVSTDHDYVTDFAPAVQALGAQDALATMVGVEVTPFDYGHHQAYPVAAKDALHGGAFDWAGGAGPSLRLDQLYAGLRAEHPGVVLQLNHPRGFGGSLTQLQVDTATSASHADPAKFRMEPNPAATAADTKLFSQDFDALELMNGMAPSLAVANDWMTFLSRGLPKTATAVSDTHSTREVLGGYGRTWVRLGVDLPALFRPEAFAQAMKAQRAVGSNGPFVTLTAQVLDSGGQPKGAAVEVGGLAVLSPSAGDTLRLTVDVQAPEWMTFDTLELYTHAGGREATNGVANGTWPDTRVLQRRTLDPLSLPVEPVPGLGGFSARRIHVRESFTVSPTADAWYVAFVRGVGGGAVSLYPLAWEGVSCDSGTGVCTARSSKAWGFTNPVFVDADGSGAWDTFPLKQGLATRPQASPAPQRRTMTAADLVELLQKAQHHDRGD